MRLHKPVDFPPNLHFAYQTEISYGLISRLCLISFYSLLPWQRLFIALQNSIIKIRDARLESVFGSKLERAP